MIRWIIKETDKTVHVETLKEDERATVFFGSKVKACEYARQIAKEKNLIYKGAKVKWIEQ